MNKNSIRKYFAILLVFLISSFAIHAQSIQVSGKVTDEAGKALEGASVQEKGTNKTAVTDAGGSFQLSVSSAKAKLLISFVGHEPLEITVGTKLSWYWY